MDTVATLTVARTDDAACREWLPRRRRLRRRTPVEHPDDLEVLLVADDHRLAADERELAAEAAVQRPGRIRAEAHPAELQQLTRAEVGRERLDDVVADEGQPEERRGADDLCGQRLDDCLLPVAPRQVVLGRVETVLADARIDDRAATIHIPPS